MKQQYRRDVISSLPCLVPDSTFWSSGCPSDNTWGSSDLSFCLLSEVLVSQPHGFSVSPWSSFPLDCNYIGTRRTSAVETRGSWALVLKREEKWQSSTVNVGGRRHWSETGKVWNWGAGPLSLICLGERRHRKEQCLSKQQGMGRRQRWILSKKRLVLVHSIYVLYSIIVYIV